LNKQVDIRDLGESLTLNEEVMDRVIRHQAYLQQLGGTEVKKVNALLDDMEQDILAQLIRRYEKIGQLGVDPGVATTARMKKLFGYLRAINDRRFREARQGLTPLLAELSRDEAEWVADLLDEASPVVLDTTIPSAELLRSIAINTPIDGTPLSGWFNKLQRSTQEELERAIRLGAAEGQTVGQMVQRVRGTRANKFTDGILYTTRRKAEAIVRTSINNVSNAARQETFAQNDDIIKGIKWVATLDTRTCPVCGGLDGKVFKPGTAHRQPPAHINCRCTMTPVLKSYRELGLDVADAPVGARASMNGAVPSDVTYNKWLRRQPKEVQDQILGPSRAALFRGNRIKINEFTNNNGKLLTLPQLKALEKRKRAS
jgi:SPP1 gp7 family putative phage head morphogenesis protein